VRSRDQGGCSRSGRLSHREIREIEEGFLLSP
jgi:hypothetical protein